MTEPNELGEGNPNNSDLPTNTPPEQSSQSSWIDKLSDENRKLVEGKGLKGTDEDLDKAIRSYAELEKSSSAKVSLPKDDDAEGMDKLMRKLGKPETPEGYIFEGATEDEKPLLDEFKTIAHKLNLPAKTAAALVKFEKELGSRIVKEREAKADAEFEKIQAQSEQRIIKDWGADATKNLELAKRGEKALCALFGDDDYGKLIKDVLPRAAFLQGAKALAANLSEDNVLNLAGAQKSDTPVKDRKAFLQSLFDEAKQ